MPDTKPDLSFDKEGVCNACQNYEERKDVDRDQRKKELIDITNKYRSPDNSNRDCIIPVSGWKDSTYQVIRVLQLGLNPLCVTATTCDLSEIWRKNIENIKKLGVDYIEFSPNPVIRHKLNKIWLLQVGDISWPEHVGIFTIPIKAAVQYNIPLIIWWENPQNEYWWPAASTKNNVLNRRRLEEFGWLLWLRVSDLIGFEGIEKRHLIPYSYPTDEELQRVGVTGVFLWHYIPWDWYANTLISQWFGFTSYPNTIEWSIVNYENLDNHQTGIHDYFKYLKFWFGRATDLICMHLRRGRLTRQDAIELAKIHDGKFPRTYLWKPIEEILKPLGMSVDEFVKICDKFTNKKIFKTDARGNLIKDADGNLMKLYPLS
jgi:N-acetyl sugar amidotransferase